jgi:hypothetical protein
MSEIKDYKVDLEYSIEDGLGHWLKCEVQIKSFRSELGKILSARTHLTGSEKSGEADGEKSVEDSDE